MQMRLGLIFYIILFIFAGSATAEDIDKHELFAGQVRVSIPKKWKQNAWDLGGYMNEQFSNGTSLSINMVVEDKKDSFLDYIQSKKKAVPAVWQEQQSNSRLKPQAGAVMADYTTASAKRFRFLCFMKGKNGFLTVDIMQTKAEALDADMIAAQSVLDSIVFE